MKQKPKRRKSKHTTATKRHKCRDIKPQTHIRFRTGKKQVKTTDNFNTIYSLKPIND